VFIRDGSSGVSVSGALSYGNYTRNGIVTRSPFTLTGWASKIERDVLIKGTVSNISIQTNNYK
jgi:hypothetical protein